MVDIKQEEQQKLEALRKEIGDDLYFRLSPSDRLFVVKTAGSVDLGYKVDLNKIFDLIADEDEFGGYYK
jgi:hypothetical protein